MSVVPRIYVVTVHGNTSLIKAVTAAQALRAALIGGHDVHPAEPEEIYELARKGLQIMDGQEILRMARAGTLKFEGDENAPA